jgi:anti-sigma regulatory factor (Ser/Thr protein kinase)
MPSPATELILPGSAASVPLARRFVTDLLEEWGLDDAAWTAQLIISELATNAALHAKTTFTVSVTPEVGGAVRIEVRDGSQRYPRIRQHDGEATTGRGLRILDELALSWGVDVVPSGKVVWALVEARPTTLSSGGPAIGEEADPHELLAAFDDDSAWDAPRAWAA